MNIANRIALLRALQTRKISSSTNRTIVALATRWVRAGVERDFDMLMRLQVLEGAAGVPIDTWMKKQRAGLALAQAHFEGKPVDPSWFSKENTGVYNIVFRCIQSVIRKLGLRRVEPLDILASNLMGLGANLDPGRARPCFATGLILANGITTGKETPQGVAKSKLCRMFMNKTWVEERKNKKDINMPVDEEGAYYDIPDKQEDSGMLKRDSAEFGEVLAEIVFRDLRNPLGVAIRNIMRASWHDSEPMLLWLTTLEKEHRYPTQKEIANKMGIAPSAFTANHWKKRWRKFFQDIRGKTSLLKNLQEAAEAEGLYWDPSELANAEIDTLLAPRSGRPRPRGASLQDQSFQRIITRFFSSY